MAYFKQLMCRRGVGGFARPLGGDLPGAMETPGRGELEPLTAHFLLSWFSFYLSDDAVRESNYEGLVAAIALYLT